MDSSEVSVNELPTPETAGDESVAGPGKAGRKVTSEPPAGDSALESDILDAISGLVTQKRQPIRLITSQRPRRSDGYQCDGKAGNTEASAL